MDSIVKKFKWIDALRGYAVLLVMMIHTGEFFKGGTFSLGFLTDNGAYGVTLFFVASSFTLFNSYQTRHRIDGKNANLFFLIRRFFRIAPLYYLVGLYSIMLGLFFKSYWISVPLNYFKILVNFLFLNGLYFPALNNIPIGGWSIGVEMLFYLSIPFLFKWIQNTRKAVFLLIAALVFSALVQILIHHFISQNSDYTWISLRQTELYVWFPNQFPVFCFGIVFYFVSKTETKLENWVILFAIGLIFLIFLMDFSYEFPKCLIQKEYFLALAFSLFGFSLAHTKFRILINPFVKLGKVSFSAYLIHFFVIELVVSVFKTCFGAGLGSNLNFGVVYGLVVISTYFVSSQTYGIEQFGIRKGEEVIKWILGRQKGKEEK
jgi:peptidoglycan/LPS O-acetylase OafA/YrhL